jgi:hypothetical protein
MSEILILDISDIHNMKRIGYLKTHDHPSRTAFYGGNLYVQNSSGGIIV